MGNASASQAALAAAAAQLEYAGERQVYRYPACKYLTIVRTIVGCAVAIGCWSAGIQTLIDNFDIYLSAYLLTIAGPITILEFGWIINKVACCEGGFCCQVWHVLEWFDSYKRGIAYALVQIPIWVIGHYTRYSLFSVLTAVGLITLAILYASTPWQYMRQHLYVIDDRNAPGGSAGGGPVAPSGGGRPQAKKDGSKIQAADVP